MSLSSDVKPVSYNVLQRHIWQPRLYLLDYETMQIISRDPGADPRSGLWFLLSLALMLWNHLYMESPAHPGPYGEYLASPSTTSALSSLGLEPGTLCFSAQPPTDWATTVLTWISLVKMEKKISMSEFSRVSFRCFVNILLH